MSYFHFPTRKVRVRMSLFRAMPGTGKVLRRSKSNNHSIFAICTDSLGSDFAFGCLAHEQTVKPCQRLQSRCFCHHRNTYWLMFAWFQVKNEKLCLKRGYIFIFQTQYSCRIMSGTLYLFQNLVETVLRVTPDKSVGCAPNTRRDRAVQRVCADCKYQGII